MVRGAVLVSGDGGQLQAILDSVYFNELPEFELVAVISTNRNANALRRAANANVRSYVVDPDLFPTATSHSIAVATKLKDMDIDLVILDDYDVSLGVIPFQFKGKVLASIPGIFPAFDVNSQEVYENTIKMGLKLSGATVYLADKDGYVGNILYQKAVEVLPEDTPTTLKKRIMEDCFWKIVPQAVAAFSENRISTKNGRTTIVPRK